MKNGIKVVSICDGISGGQEGLRQAGISISEYNASEIDKHAIWITQKNYPKTIQLGDVMNIDFTKFKDIDLLIGGTPCQSLSITQSQTRQGLDGKSKLFFEFVRALQEIKPKYFLLENVASMSKECKRVMSDYMGCEPYLIDSNCVSAQDRKRLYWTNIPLNINNFKECDLSISDIKEENVDEKYFYTHPLLNVDMSKQVCALMDFKNNEMHKRIFNPNFKCHTLTTCGGGNTQKKILENGRARKLTPLEYERLQTFPDNYTQGVADTHRYTALGNGWTAALIAEIFKGMKQDQNIITAEFTPTQKGLFDIAQ